MPHQTSGPHHIHNSTYEFRSAGRPRVGLPCRVSRNLKIDPSVLKLLKLIPAASQIERVPRINEDWIVKLFLSLPASPAPLPHPMLLACLGSPGRSQLPILYFVPPGLGCNIPQVPTAIARLRLFPLAVVGAWPPWPRRFLTRIPAVDLLSPPTASGHFLCYMLPFGALPASP